MELALDHIHWWAFILAEVNLQVLLLESFFILPVQVVPLRVSKRPVNSPFSDLTVLPTPEMEMNTFGLIGALMIAWARDCVVLTRLAHTFCLKPGVQRRVGSRTFCPATLTTATVLTGKPDSASSVWKKWKNSKVVCLLESLYLLLSGTQLNFKLKQICHVLIARCGPKWDA
jgi:hypothetical protein